MASVGFGKNTRKEKLDRFYMRANYVDPKTGTLNIEKAKILITDLPYVVCEHQVFHKVSKMVEGKRVEKTFIYNIKCNKEESGRCVACERTGQRGYNKTVMPIVHFYEYYSKKKEANELFVSKKIYVVPTTLQGKFIRNLGEDYEKWIGTFLFVFRGAEKSSGSGDDFEVIPNKIDKAQTIIEVANKHNLNLDRYNAINIEEAALEIMSNEQMVKFFDDLEKEKRGIVVDNPTINNKDSKYDNNVGGNPINNNNPVNNQPMEDDDIPF